MDNVNPVLLSLARRRIMEKAGFVPPGGGMPGGDPAAAGGDPAAGGMPPADPAAAGGMPPGGAPMDPSMMGGAPPAGGAPQAAPQAPLPGSFPGGAMPPAGQAAPQKIKPEQMMQMLDFRLYNMQQQLTAIINHIGASVDSSVLVLPPGSTGAPPAETAMPGGPMAPPPAPAGQGGQGGPGGQAGGSAIQPVQAMDAATPQPKQASDERSPSFIGQPTDLGIDVQAEQLGVQANAVLAMLRARRS